MIPLCGKILLGHNKNARVKLQKAVTSQTKSETSFYQSFIFRFFLLSR